MLREFNNIRREWQDTIVAEATEHFDQFDSKIMTKAGKGKDFAIGGGQVVGNESSFGIKLLDKMGMAATIDDLVD